jgi:ribosomal-protein-alanine N-acetyltransferase
VQMSKSEIEKDLESPNEQRYYIIEKRDGSKIGFISHFYFLHIAGRLLEIGYALTLSERGKGYGTEAVQFLVDHIFLSKEVARIQACTDTRNVFSQRVLAKAGFRREGAMRNRFFMRGNG